MELKHTTSTSRAIATRHQAIHTVDAIIRYQGGIVVIERAKAPFGLALPGGHVEENESLEQAVEREAREETRLRLAGARQFRTYSEPDRDPRGRYISTVFIADGYGQLASGSDAKRATVIPEAQVSGLADQFAFDHYKIVSDYLAERGAQPAASPAIPQELPTRITPASRGGTYFVFHDRNQYAKRTSEDRRPQQVYSKMTKFTDLEKAVDFAEDKMPACLLKRLPLGPEDMAIAGRHQNPYVVVGTFVHTDSDMDSWSTYTAIRCQEKDLDAVTDALCHEGARQVTRGLELRMA